MEAIQGLTETFNHPNITNPFRQLESRYQQEKFYKEHLNLLVGIKIYIYYILTIAITTQIVTIITVTMTISMLHAYFLGLSKNCVAITCMVYITCICYLSIHNESIVCTYTGAS